MRLDKWLYRRHAFGIIATTEKLYWGTFSSMKQIITHLIITTMDIINKIKVEDLEELEDAFNHVNYEDIETKAECVESILSYAEELGLISNKDIDSTHKLLDSLKASVQGSLANAVLLASYFKQSKDKRTRQDVVDLIQMQLINSKSNLCALKFIEEGIWR